MSALYLEISGVNNTVNGQDNVYLINPTAPGAILKLPSTVTAHASFIVLNVGAQPFALWLDPAGARVVTGGVAAGDAIIVGGSTALLWEWFRREFHQENPAYFRERPSPCGSGDDPPDDPGPVGAICYANGTCVQGTEQDAEDTGGTYGGDGSTCEDVVCDGDGDPTGAICCYDGECYDGTQNEADDFDCPFEQDVTCAELDCEPRGCCCVEGVGQQWLTQEECDLLGGSYCGDEVDCCGAPGARPLCCNCPA
jgi:hypothetical protein